MRLAKLNRIVAGLVLALGGCNKDASAPPDSDRELPIEGAVLSGSAPTGLEERVKGVAAEYQKWGRVDDDARWAPGLCRPPTPSLVRFSKSHDMDTHGRKLYYVFAYGASHYRSLSYIDILPGKNPKSTVGDAKMGPSSEQTNMSPSQIDYESRIGQVIVKQSWQSVEADAPPKPSNHGPFEYPGAKYEGTQENPNYFLPYATRGGKTYRTGKQGPLFIMMKVGEDDSAIETDAGWVYATIEPDTREITGLGKIASCMKCHVDAPYDRLFGLPK